jgi:hypothetical protein
MKQIMPIAEKCETLPLKELIKLRLKITLLKIRVELKRSLS